LSCDAEAIVGANKQEAGNEVDCRRGQRLRKRVNTTFDTQKRLRNESPGVYKEGEMGLMNINNMIEPANT